MLPQQAWLPRSTFAEVMLMNGRWDAEGEFLRKKLAGQGGQLDSFHACWFSLANTQYHTMCFFFPSAKPTFPFERPV